MLNNFSKGKLNIQFHLQLFKALALVTNSASLLIYIFMHFILFDFPFDVSGELLMLVKLIGVATGFALAVNVLILFADMVELIAVRKKKILVPAHLKSVTIGLILIVIILSACNGRMVNAGIKKDFNTGMSSTYNGMEPEKVMLVMNNEVLGHTDIPLGESFLIVNDGIKGMQSKNGKVKVGCSLSITDKKGQVLLNEKDLFAGHDEFEEKDAKMLKCTVSTGEPMQWEENYDVAVTFWDKNGNGKIENKVTIRSIDMP